MILHRNIREDEDRAFLAQAKQVHMKVEVDKTLLFKVFHQLAQLKFKIEVH